MNKSILVLDENSVIHGLISSALETEGLTLHHEFNPGKFVERANSLMPDLILLGNSEQDPEHEICRSLKSSRQLSEVPLVMLAGSKERLTRDLISRLKVDGIVRKPFEASDLQQQVSKHLDLVDLVGSAYEYRRSQASFEEGPNPLANLDVLDEDVLGLLRGAVPAGDGSAQARGPAAAAKPASGPFKAAPVVDDEVLAETLQPERAFEPVAAGAKARFETLETLDGEFPDDALELPESEAELDELGAADVLEEDTPEEAVFEPQGFDQELEARPGARDRAELDDIEVELPDDGVDSRAMDKALEDSAVDLFESDLAEEEPPAAGDRAGGYEESIPLSVRRMMELKPVFTMTQEESVEGDDALDFEPEEGDVAALQEDLDELEPVDLEASDTAEMAELDSVDLETAAQYEEPDEAAEAAAGPVREQPLEFADAKDVAALEDELAPPEDFRLTDEEPGEPPEPEAAKAERVELEFETLEAEAPSPPDREPEAPRAAQAAPAHAAPKDADKDAVQEEDDYFVEEYLGDEEIDEDQLIAAEDGDTIEELPELSAEDGAELDQLMAEEEGLDDLDGLDLDEDADAAPEEADDDIELDEEEEDRILTSLESERDETARVAAAAPEPPPAPASAPGRQPLFERNFNALDEESAAAEEEDETWQLEQEDGGFAMADADDEEGAELEPEEVIDLSTPERDEELLEEVPMSALEEVDESGEPIAAEAAEAGALDEPVSIEFGEGDAPVFEADAEESPAWTPKAPPSFVARPSEDFPQDAVSDPFTGPEGEPTEPEPPSSPRHERLEVLEDPESLQPILEEDAAPAEADEDMADRVQAEELDAVPMEPSELEAPDDLAPEERLSVITDDALQGVDGDAALDEQALDDELGDDAGVDVGEEGSMADAFEPVQPEAPDTSDAEVNALLAGDERGMEGLDDLVADDAEFDEADADEEDLETLLGAGHEDATPAEAEVSEENAAAAESTPVSHDPEFDNVFASLREEIAANPEGEHLDDVLRNERIRDRAADLEFALPQHENTFARAMGVYELIGDGDGGSAYPGALTGGAARPRGAAKPAVAARPVASAKAAVAAATVAAAASTAPGPVPPPTYGEATAAASLHALSLLDPDIRAKLGQVLDEIISISVRKAVQEEMPKIMERMARDQ